MDEEQVREQFAQMAAGLRPLESISLSPAGFSSSRRFVCYPHPSVVEKVLKPFARAYAQGLVRIIGDRRTDERLLITVESINERW